MTGILDRISAALFAAGAGMFGGILLGIIAAMLRDRGASNGWVVAVVVLTFIGGVEVARRKVSTAIRIAAAAFFVAFVLMLIVLAPHAR